MSCNSLDSTTKYHHVGKYFDFNNRSSPYQTDSFVLEERRNPLAIFEDDRNYIFRSRAWARLDGIYQFAINYNDPRLTNRQTHSLKVKDTAEKIARILGLGRESQMLAGNIGLVHDIGHPPFAHWGQLAIKKALQPYGFNWNHDTAGIRILTDWMKYSNENRHFPPTFIEGVVKRFWRYDQSKSYGFYNHQMTEIPDLVKEIDRKYNGVMKFEGFNHIEGQIAAQSDRLSFNVTDLEDGLRIGRFTPEMIKSNFPFAWNILDKTLDDFLIESKITISSTEQFQFVKEMIAKDNDMMGFIYHRFAISFHEALMKDLLDNTQINLEKAIDLQLIHNAEDIRNVDHVCVEFSSTLNEQFKNFARFCREHIFTITAPFEHLVSAMIYDYRIGKVSLPQLWQKIFDETSTIAEKIEIIATFLTCEVTDRDVIRHVFKHSPEIYYEYCPQLEWIRDNDITFDTATQRTTELFRKSEERNLTVPIITADDLDFTDNKSIPVISTTNKFILNVPQIGETIQIMKNGKYKFGEEFHLGDPIKSPDNRIISERGITFYNSINDQWLAAISGLKDNDCYVIILNEVTEEQAKKLEMKLEEYGHPEEMTISQLKDILLYAESLGITDYYPSNVGFIKEMMEISDSVYGWKQRKETQICRAIYIEGVGEFIQPFGESQKFNHGVFIIKTPTGEIHVVDNDVALRTYRHLDNSFIEKGDVPLQEPSRKEKFKTIHDLPNSIASTKIVIIGAGVSGIATATYLIQEFIHESPFGHTLIINIIDSNKNPAGSTYNRPSPGKVKMANPIGCLGIQSATACIEHINGNPDKWKNIFCDVNYEEHQGFDGQASIPHVQYGEYIRDHFQSIIKFIEASKAPVEVRFIRDRVIKTTEDVSKSKCWMKLGSGREISADVVVYALGNANPKPLTDHTGRTLCGQNGYYNLDDHAFTPENVNETDFTVIVGTGNGACFSALWAVDHGYQGKFLLVSRSGRVPHVANQSKPFTRSICTVKKFVEEIKETESRTADCLMELFHQEMREAHSAGFQWRDVVDSMFTDTNTLWRAMNHNEQQCFVERYGALWFCARYRIPNEQWEQVEKLRKEGRLEITGRLQYIELVQNTGFKVIIKNHDGSLRTIETCKIVNNTGPSRYVEQMPVCAKELVTSGLARMHHNGGFDVDDHFRLINTEGQSLSRFYALGPIVSGSHPESITIPAIRSNAMIISKSLIDYYITKRRNEFHYSGYNHKPYDYSTMNPNVLSDRFKKTRFARSLTNISPRNYTDEEKTHFYTVEFAEKALASGDISAPRDKTVLWSGGHIPSHPLGYGLGRIIAERWLVEKNVELELKGEDLYYTVAMTEAGLPVLNEMWDDLTIPLSLKKQVTPIYILGFAACAYGEISLNVDDTDLDSFFRENELQVVMENPNITSVRAIRVNRETDLLQEILYENRHKWYNDQKDQWVDSVIIRYQLAHNIWKRDNSHLILYERMSQALFDEFYDSYTNVINGNKFIQQFYKAIGLEYTQWNQKLDKALEIIRLKKFAPLIEINPNWLKNDKINSEQLQMAFLC
ncbi:unnamed protein product [Adineta ricciae]|uniref:Uncharacterized protein n=1 Tax=Adineta ricciae TaxID=249248 RepID=A0A815FLW4_ADIRI|nr:unnamed protein product [Adineta ricciae]